MCAHKPTKVVIVTTTLAQGFSETHNQNTNVFVLLNLQPVNKRLVCRAKRQAHTSRLNEVQPKTSRHITQITI